MKVSVRDLRKCNYCIKGAKVFFMKHNLDWEKFKRGGIEANELEATKDGMALKLVEAVKNGQ